jgi:hypothetical protein
MGDSTPISVKHRIRIFMIGLPAYPRDVTPRLIFLEEMDSEVYRRLIPVIGSGKVKKAISDLGRG